MLVYPNSCAGRPARRAAARMRQGSLEALDRPPRMGPCAGAGVRAPPRVAYCRYCPVLAGRRGGVRAPGAAPHPRAAERASGKRAPLARKRSMQPLGSARPISANSAVSHSYSSSRPALSRAEQQMEMRRRAARLSHRRLKDSRLIFAGRRPEGAACQQANDWRSVCEQKDRAMATA